MGTTEQKLEYLATTKTKIKDSINLTGAGITTEPFRQYAVKLKDAYVDIINNGTDTLYNNFPKVSGSGTDLSLQNTYEAPMRSTLKGNTSQEGTPTPDSPQDIHNVSGNNDIIVCGKNLFDKSNYNYLNAYFNSGATQYLYSNANSTTIYIPCKPNTTYTIQKVSGQRFAFGYTKETPTINTNVYGTVGGNSTATKYTITTGSDAKYLVSFVLNVNVSGEPTLQQVLDSIQIEESTTDTTYEAYNGTTYNINLPNGMELCKIGTYQDYIYKEDDKWYLHKEIGKVVLDGSETGWEKLNTCYRLGTTLFNDLLSPELDNMALTNGFIYWKNTGGITTHIPDLMFGWTASKDAINIRYDLITSVDNFKTYLSNNNMVVYYVLATPTNTEITDTTLISQLEAIYNAKSKNGTTNINQENNDLPFIITASALEKGQ